jgi:hypothetical protein
MGNRLEAVKNINIRATFPFNLELCLLAVEPGVELPGSTGAGPADIGTEDPLPCHIF